MNLSGVLETQTFSKRAFQILQEFPKLPITISAVEKFKQTRQCCDLDHATKPAFLYAYMRKVSVPKRCRKSAL